jgi:hypothetical protein
MMMLGRIIMNFVADRDSWDQRSMMMGMGGMGMGGMGMGGMGMGGMGMGGMGGGFRSVPPTGPPEAVVNPGQTRHLPTPLVSLGGPNGAGGVSAPQRGEKLQIGDISQVGASPRAEAALRRLTVEKAPQTVTQLVLWRVKGGMDWDAIVATSRSWANPYEIALARRFVERLEREDGEQDSTTNKATTMTTRPELSDPGRFSFQISDPGIAAAGHAARLAELRTDLSGRRVLGLTARPEIPARPDGPGLACEISLTGETSNPRLDVRLAATSPDAGRWVPAGRFSISLRDDKGKDRPAAELADDLAAQALSTLVRAEVAPGPRVKGKPSYQITIRNTSPMVLSGLAVTGTSEGEKPTDPSLLSGLCVPPRKSLKVPASAEFVERLKLKKGVKVVAADLSGV